MSKIFDRAIAEVRKLPSQDQDAVGAIMLALADDRLSGLTTLDEETRVAIREGLEQARRGEFVPEQEIEAI